jgi:hypothetical protein
MRQWDRVYDRDTGRKREKVPSRFVLELILA